MMTHSVSQVLGSGFLSVALLFFILWVIHLRIKNAGIVDVGWGLGFIMLCGIDIAYGQGLNLRNSLLLLMVVLWGSRITFFLIKRISREGHEDKRYQKMRDSWGRPIALKFLFFFECQAILQMILAVPFLFVSLNAKQGIAFWERLGLITFAVALLGETIADEQLQHFKTNPANKGITCNEGLWNYSRHPNYFFEWMIWTGFFLYALGSPHGWIAVISPAIMYYLIVYVSGVPLAEEQALKSRGDDYRKYQATTSVFFPMPKRVH